MTRGSCLSGAELPPLPLDEWLPTKETLHRYAQTVGKVRLDTRRTATTGGTSRSTSPPAASRSRSPSISSPTNWRSSPARADAPLCPMMPTSSCARDTRTRSSPSVSGREMPTCENPASAPWQEGDTALLMYEEVRKSSSPKDTLLKFLQSAYQAGAKAANWNIEDFETRSETHG